MKASASSTAGKARTGEKRSTVSPGKGRIDIDPRETLATPSTAGMGKKKKLTYERAAKKEPPVRQGSDRCHPIPMQDEMPASPCSDKGRRLQREKKMRNRERNEPAQCNRIRGSGKKTQGEKGSNSWKKKERAARFAQGGEKNGRIVKGEPRLRAGGTCMRSEYRPFRVYDAQLLLKRIQKGNYAFNLKKKRLNSNYAESFQTSLSTVARGKKKTSRKSAVQKDTPLLSKGTPHHDSRGKNNGKRVLLNFLEENLDFHL